MASITNAQVLEATKVSDTQNYVLLKFTLDTGETFVDGPRFLPIATDLNVYAIEVGNRLLELLAANEVQQWLSA